MTHDTRPPYGFRDSTAPRLGDLAHSIPGAGVWINDAADGGLDGEPAALVVMWAARTLLAGIALVSLAIVEWDGLPGLMRDCRGELTSSAVIEVRAPSELRITLQTRSPGCVAWLP